MEEPKKKKKSKKSDKKKRNDSDVQIEVEDEENTVTAEVEVGLNNNDTHKKSGKRKNKQLECPVEEKKIKVEVMDVVKDEPDCSNKAEGGVTMRAEDWVDVEIDEMFDFDEDLSSDDEVYYLRVSDKLDPQSLTGRKLTFKESKSLNVEGDEFKVNFDGNNAPKLNLIAKRSGGLDVRHIQTSGCFTINPEMELEDVKNFVSKQKISTVPAFPSGLLKQRHPLFGIQYEEKINLDKDIVSRLEAPRHVPKSSKKKSKKNKAACNEDIFNLLSNHKS